MAIAILAELLVVDLGEAPVSPALGRWSQDRRVQEFFASLDATRQRAFLEIVAGAALEDGRLSDAERQWLEDRRASSKRADVVDAVLATATELLPPRDQAGAVTAYLAERAAVLTEVAEREMALAVAAIVLLQSGAADRDATIAAFGAALGASDARTREVLALVASGQLP